MTLQLHFLDGVVQLWVEQAERRVVAVGHSWVNIINSWVNVINSW